MHRPPLFRRRTVRALLVRGNWLLRCAVILSLWHAPLPWVHFHDLAGQQVEQLAPLARHVAEFHGSDLSHGVTALDWHVHVVLPWALDSDPGCPADHELPASPGDPCPVLATQGTVSWEIAPSGFTSAVWAAQSLLAEPFLASAERHSSLLDEGLERQFLSAFCLAGALRNLTSVRLC